MRRAGGTVIAGESSKAGAGDGPNGSIGGQFPDAVIIGIRNVDIAPAVRGNSLGLAQDAGRCGTPIPGVGASGHGGYAVDGLCETGARPRCQQ